MHNSIEHYDPSKHGQIIESKPRTGFITLFLGFIFLIPPILFMVNAFRYDGLFRHDGNIPISTWLYNISIIVGMTLFACLMLWIFIRNRLKVKNFSKDIKAAYEKGKVTTGKVLSVIYRKTGQSHQSITGYFFRYEFIDEDRKTRKRRAYFDNATYTQIIQSIDFGNINLMRTSTYKEMKGFNITVLFTDKLSFALGIEKP